MAWWNTQLVFQGDTLIAEGLDPTALMTSEAEVVVQEERPANGAEAYTRVIVSGYALYGRLWGYYALGVSHWYLDRTAGRIFMTGVSEHNNEPVSSLSSAQRAIVREFLMGFNPEAWEASTRSFRKRLEA